jgi:hypothetical protein
VQLVQLVQEQLHDGTSALAFFINVNNGLSLYLLFPIKRVIFSPKTKLVIKITKSRTILVTIKKFRFIIFAIFLFFIIAPKLVISRVNYPQYINNNIRVKKKIPIVPIKPTKEMGEGSY